LICAKTKSVVVFSSSYIHFKRFGYISGKKAKNQKKKIFFLA